MRILWITNQPVPVIAKDIGIPAGVSGGWMNETSRQLAEKNEFGMAFPVMPDKEYKEGYSGNIYYYAIPMNKRQTRVKEKHIEDFERIIKKFHPDLIHIWGTEYMHTYYAVNACKNVGMIEKTVISIQGLVSVIAGHYYGHIEESKFRFPTLKDILYFDSLKRQKKNFVMRGKYEILSIKMVNHIIGRTDWDEACTKQINSNVNYYKCNETLRNTFYQKNWNLATCEKHSLFVSQCQYPLKGFHHVLEALAILVKQWPGTHLYTTGRDLLVDNYKERILDSGYERYLRRQIKKLNLEKNITFLGWLDEGKMCERFCKSHVFISASSIENSPNSVGEAMCLGVPVVASDVGGVKNMMLHGEEGFVYQPDASYMIAYYVARIFEDDNLAEKFSQNEKKHALQTHSKEQNYTQMLNIYQKIVSKKED